MNDFEKDVEFCSKNDQISCLGKDVITSNKTTV